MSQRTWAGEQASGGEARAHRVTGTWDVGGRTGTRGAERSNRSPGRHWADAVPGRSGPRGRPGMKRSRTKLAWLAVWLLALSCAAPAALSAREANESEVSGDETEVLESGPPGPTRPPPRPPSRPGRGGRSRDRNPTEPRERVFNAEPTPQQREAARLRRENAALEQTLRERYWRHKAEAERLYPNKVGLSTRSTTSGRSSWEARRTGRSTGCRRPTTSSSPTPSGTSGTMAGANRTSRKRKRS